MTTSTKRWTAAGGLIAALLLAPAVVSAQGFRLSPVRLTLTEGAPIGSLTLTNGGHSAVSIQAESLEWAQADGREVLTPSDRLLVSPPIFTLPAGGRQVVRVARRSRTPVDPGRELSFRLFFTELPGDRGDDGDDGDGGGATGAPGSGGGVSLRLRVGIPVFVVGARGVSPRPAARLAADATGRPALVLANSGTAHLQVLTLTLREGATGRTVFERTRPAYLLPGTERRLELAGGGEEVEAALAAAGDLELLVASDAGPFRLPVER